MGQGQSSARCWRRTQQLVGSVGPWSMTGGHHRDAVRAGVFFGKGRNQSGGGWVRSGIYPGLKPSNPSGDPWKVSRTFSWCSRPFLCPRLHPIFQDYPTFSRSFPHVPGLYPCVPDLILCIPDPIPHGPDPCHMAQTSSHLSQSLPTFPRPSSLQSRPFLFSRPFPMFETLSQPQPALSNAVYSPNPSLTPVSSPCSLTLP